MNSRLLRNVAITLAGLVALYTLLYLVVFKMFMGTPDGF